VPAHNNNKATTIHTTTATTTIIIITGLFQATRPIANTNNTKLHTQKKNTHKHHGGAEADKIRTNAPSN